MTRNKNKNKVKRFIDINGIKKRLSISRVTEVKTTKQFIHLDELKDGSWRLCYTSGTIPDLTKVDSFDIIREN